MVILTLIHTSTLKIQMDPGASTSDTNLTHNQCVVLCCRNPEFHHVAYNALLVPNKNKASQRKATVWQMKTNPLQQENQGVPKRKTKVFLREVLTNYARACPTQTSREGPLWFSRSIQTNLPYSIPLNISIEFQENLMRKALAFDPTERPRMC